MSLRLRTTFAVAALAALGACGGGGGDSDARADGPATDQVAGPEAVEVTIDTFDFQPDPLTVPAGTTITFRNLDEIDHTVTAGTRDAPAPDVFDATLDGAGTTVELVLDEPGTYDYFCRIHPGPGMTAVIVVE